MAESAAAPLMTEIVPGVEVGGAGVDGNQDVRVVTRLRPLLAGEVLAEPSPSFSSTTSCCCQSLDADAAQAELAPLAAGLASDATVGLRAALLAYGAPGSGKSHSLYGPLQRISSAAADKATASHGVLPMVAERLFALLRRLNADGRGDWQVSVACAEVQGKHVWDLLSEGEATALTRSQPRRDPEIREHPHCGVVFVPGLTEDVIDDAGAFVTRLARSCRARALRAPSPAAGPPAEPCHAVIDIRVLQRRHVAATGGGFECSEEQRRLQQAADGCPPDTPYADAGQRLIRTPGWAKLQALVRERRSVSAIGATGDDGDAGQCAWSLEGRILAIELAASPRWRRTAAGASNNWRCPELRPVGGTGGIEALSAAVAQLSAASGSSEASAGAQHRRREAVDLLAKSSGTGSGIARLLAGAFSSNCRPRLLAALSPAAADLPTTEATLEVLAAAAPWIHGATGCGAGSLSADCRFEQLEVEVSRLRRALELSSHDVCIPAALNSTGAPMDVATRLEISERLLADAKQPFENRRFDSNAREQRLRRAEQERVAAGVVTSRQIEGSPLLVRLCSDALLSGAVLYEARPGCPALVAGSDPSCTIWVSGPGTGPQMCSIVAPEREAEAPSSPLLALSVRRAPGIRVRVDGSDVAGSRRPIALPLGTVLELGYSHAFQVRGDDGSGVENHFDPAEEDCVAALGVLRGSLTPPHGIDEEDLAVSAELAARRLGFDRASAITSFARRWREAAAAAEEAQELLQSIGAAVDQASRLPMVDISIGLALCPGRACDAGPDVVVRLMEGGEAPEASAAVHGACVWWDEAKFRRRLALLREAVVNGNGSGVQSWSALCSALREFDPEERGAVPSATASDSKVDIDSERLLERIREQEEDLHILRERLAASRRGGGSSVVRQVRDMQEEIDGLREELAKLREAHSASAAVVSAGQRDVLQGALCTPFASLEATDAGRSSEQLEEIRRLQADLLVAVEETRIGRVLLCEEFPKQQADEELLFQVQSRGLEAESALQWEARALESEEAAELERLRSWGESELEAQQRLASVLERREREAEAQLLETQGRLSEVEAQLEATGALVEQRLDAVEEERLRMEQYSREAVRCLREELYAVESAQSRRPSMSTEHATVASLRSELAAEKQRASETQATVVEFKALVDALNAQKLDRHDSMRAELESSEAKCRAAEIGLQQAETRMQEELQTHKQRELELQNRLGIAEAAIEDGQCRMAEARANEEQALSKCRQLEVDLQRSVALESELSAKFQSTLEQLAELKANLDKALIGEREAQAARCAAESSLSSTREALKDLERDMQSRSRQHESERQRDAETLQTRELHWAQLRDAVAAELERERESGGEKFRALIQREETLSAEVREAQRRRERMDEKIERLQEDLRTRDVQIEGLKRDAYRLRKEYSKLLAASSRERRQQVEGNAQMGAFIKEVTENMTAVDADISDFQQRLESMSRAASAANSPATSRDRGALGMPGTVGSPAPSWIWPRSLSPCPPLPRGSAASQSVGSSTCQAGVYNQTNCATPASASSPMPFRGASSTACSRGPPRRDGSPGPRISAAGGTNSRGANPQWGGDGDGSGAWDSQVARPLEPEEEAEAAGSSEAQRDEVARQMGFSDQEDDQSQQGSWTLQQLKVGAPSDSGSNRSAVMDEKPANRFEASFVNSTEIRQRPTVIRHQSSGVESSLASALKLIGPARAGEGDASARNSNRTSTMSVEQEEEQQQPEEDMEEVEAEEEEDVKTMQTGSHASIRRMTSRKLDEHLQAALVAIAPVPSLAASPMQSGSSSCAAPAGPPGSMQSVSANSGPPSRGTPVATPFSPPSFGSSVIAPTTINVDGIPASATDNGHEASVGDSSYGNSITCSARREAEDAAADGTSANEPSFSEDLTSEGAHGVEGGAEQEPEIQEEDFHGVTVPIRGSSVAAAAAARHAALAADRAAKLSWPQGEQVSAGHAHGQLSVARGSSGHVPVGSVVVGQGRAAFGYSQRAQTSSAQIPQYAGVTEDAALPSQPDTMSSLMPRHARTFASYSGGARASMLQQPVPHRAV